MRPDHKARDGKRSELIAASWLISQNCYVYAPFIEQGPVDLIALVPTGEVFLFDVKTVGRRKNGSIISRLLTDVQRKLGVRLLYVDLETKMCALYPHQLSTNPNHSASVYATQQTSNRHFGGGPVPTIDGLLRQEFSQKAQSYFEESLQYERPPNPWTPNQHTSQDDADQSDVPDPPTEPSSQD